MILEEYFNYRSELLEQSKDEEGFIHENLILSQVLPSMLDAKLIDTEDYTNSYFISKIDNLKVNAYSINESGERLQLFIINEGSIDLTAKEDDLRISTKAEYEKQFKRCLNFHNKAIKGHLNDEIQDSSPVRPLVSNISSSEGARQFDVVEIFLISLSSTVSLRGASIQPSKIVFDDDVINVNYSENRERKSKELLIKKRIIDLNFLYNVLISQGSREALKVDFKRTFGEPIHAIKAADEDYFESYLCVLPASMISKLYREFSTRLLEKNVRSFLQFRGVNKGIRETIRKEPEKFVAYNNGLTITATDGEILIENGQYIINSLTDFQIVNGGQTTATIYFTQKDGFDVSNVKVMAKINVAKEATSDELEELISNISTYSNAQSRVSKVDLRSRNPQLVKIKSLSDSVMTPSGNKWFFERAKGEYNTKLRIAGGNKARLQKEYPPQRRFSKELMAKYFSAWGNQPHLVKKGGEKIFRYFIENLTGEGEFKKPIEVNRDFYEELIAKIILFRELEKVYGSGKNSMGQLRSAVVPYTISILYSITDGNKDTVSFDLTKIWLNERLEDDLKSYLTSLLELVNELIKQYSASDDYGEFSKKEVLWKSIIESKELKSWINNSNTNQILSKYGISKRELAKRRNKSDSNEVNFKIISDNILIHSNGADYYNEIKNENSFLSDTHIRYLDKIVGLIISKENLSDKDIKIENELTNLVRSKNPSFFDKERSSNYRLYDSLQFVIKNYNNCLNNKSDITSEFNRLKAIGIAKELRFSSVFGKLGIELKNGNAPSVKQIYDVNSYLNQNIETNEKKVVSSIDVDFLPLNEFTLRKIFEWDSRAKILSEKERNYIADFAWGLKKMNKFHENNIRRHISTLVKNGFNLK